MESNNNNHIDPEAAKILKTIFTWIGIIICLNVFWPVGLYLIYRQLTKPSVKNSKLFTTIREGWNNAKDEFLNRNAAQSTTSYSASSSAPKKKEKKKKLPQANGALLLLILAIVLFIIGASNIIEGIDYYDMLQTVMGVFNVIGGGAALGARQLINRRARRLTKYITVMGFDDAKSVDEISEITGFSKKLIRKDLNYLAERGYFGDTAYFDIGLDSIVISPEAAENERTVRYAAEQSKKTSAAADSNTYASTLANMRKLRGEIIDPEISQKVDHLIEVTAKIFKIVEENPGKEPMINKFTEYYLPSTGKLLRSYSMLERQGITGKNIDAAKQDIERILDSLTEGYERQLDKLFDSDVLDISSDVDVLETMLKQDGLTDDGFKSSKSDSEGGQTMTSN
ncbi:MAG: 5-bromo-4-chloroindolyl phosphate hydrolysis family protein [Oscillospiraceae bacterium]|nr:5-bromo-4-chloroindolyl phosphate hydrolysis family protein [Oscillospiraceae bacterium]